MSKSTPEDLPVLEPDRSALFLDYDGTLVPIAATPAEAHADGALCDLLVRLERRLAGAIAIVSGRPVADIDRFLDPLQLTVAGLHGLEVLFADGRLEEHAAPAALLAPARAELTALVARYPGTMLEDKRLSLALHFRQAPEAVAMADAVATRLAMASAGALRLQRGKMVVELLPSGRDKGRAIDHLLTQPAFAGRLPVFVGDDITDEAGFAAVNRQRGLSVRIGLPDGETVASHVLPDISALQNWLERSLAGRPR